MSSKYVVLGLREAKYVVLGLQGDLMQRVFQGDFLVFLFCFFIYHFISLVSRKPSRFATQVSGVRDMWCASSNHARAVITSPVFEVGTCFSLTFSFICTAKNIRCEFLCRLLDVLLSTRPPRKLTGVVHAASATRSPLTLGS